MKDEGDNGRPFRIVGGLNTWRFFTAERSRWLAGVGALVVTMLGGVTLVGWMTDSTQLKALFGHGVTMKANTAIGLLSAGGAFALLTVPRDASLRWRRVGRWVALISLGIAGLTLVENLVGWDLGIDQLFFTEPPGALATASPGRMGLPGSTGITFAAVALLLFGTKIRSLRLASQFLGIGVLMIAVVPIMGYAYDLQRFYSVPKYTGIAAHTAVALAFLGLALVLGQPDRGVMAVVLKDDTGGLMARRLFLPGLLLPFLVWWIRLLLEENGYVTAATARVFAVLFLSVCTGALILSSAVRISHLEGQRNRVQAERERERERVEVERAANEQALRRAKDEAERASRAKSEFLATLSHELRTPLAPVSATLAVLETQPNLPPEIRADFQMMRRNVDIEVRLIGDLLDLTRVEHGKITLDFDEVNLNAVLASVADMCTRPGAPGIKLELLATPTLVRGDSVRLHQVIWNLVTNSQKFTPTDGSIVLRTARGGETHWLVQVTDTGRGIVPDLMPRLFTAFEQGSSSSAGRDSGLGLGLAICRKIVELHGGTIAAASAGPGQGSTFTVTLPAAAAKLSPVDATPAPVSTIVAQPWFILLVEDHDATRLAMTRLLENLGHKVVAAANCADARAAVERERPNFLVSDLALPDGNGLDLMRELHSHFQGRAVALSGYGMESDIQDALAAGFSTHLTKPVALGALRQALARRG